MQGIKLGVDVVLLLAFAAASLPRGTGLAAHEWLAIAFIVPMFVHLVINWPWIVAVTRRLFSRMPLEVRFNQLLDLSIYVVMVLVLFSGIAESRVALPALGIDGSRDRFWVGLHRVTANGLMVMLGAHLAMHWRWLVAALRDALGRVRSVVAAAESRRQA